MNNQELTTEFEQVAVIGMAGRFPGARNIDEFWENLRKGVESIRSFSEKELTAAGLDERIRRDPSFVNAGAPMPEADAFDASFFGISVREAEIMDPQHRVFLETAWEALENAGYDPENCPASIGVFGGVAPNTYFQTNLASRPDLLSSLGRYPVMLASEKEYAITRVSYKLNLTGPSISVNTACSSSGVAIHLACQSLLNGECDIALAGGARIMTPITGGYMYEEGGILSPDGHCRPFDAEAHGTVIGNGVALIVLKRLSEAIHDDDQILAMIKGSAVNNDGSQKAGFTAPSVQGQASVIEQALTFAGVNPETIGYVEAHGTGTSLGDPIEVAALTKAYRRWTNKKNYCPIGSVKSNIGHLDAAAGVAGVIKTILALQNKQIPASLNFIRPNPQIDFENSPFYVNASLSPWPESNNPRRAAVSSFGLGGTNAHIILEEAPVTQESGLCRQYQILLLSAKSETALERSTLNLVEHLRQHPQVKLVDIAHTLQSGRRAFNHRRILVCQNPLDAITSFESLDPKRVKTSVHEPFDRNIIFMFSGQGSHYVKMGYDLYIGEPKFRQQVDHCLEIVRDHLPLNLRDLLYPDEKHLLSAAQLLDQTAVTQPALFSIEYALTMQWIDWGVQPQAMVGHSIGEYVAACLSGVFSLEQALALVCARGRLIQELPGGTMLAIRLPENDLGPYLNAETSLAAVNGPAMCVVSGETEAICELESRLSKQSVETSRLRTSHAFHSKMMDPILEPFKQEISKIKLNAPKIPFVSNVTGTWITPEEAIDANYWVRHLRQTVRFSDCLKTLLTPPNKLLMEVGPGRSLSTLAKQHSSRQTETIILSSTRHPKEEGSDLAFILNSLGLIWLAGIKVDWTKVNGQDRHRRVSLPTYPFERKQYWISPGKLAQITIPQTISTNGSEPELLSQAPLEKRSQTVQPGAPRNDAEKALIDIWQGLLGVENLQIFDNFFEQGGSSLLATRLFTQISKVFNKRLPIATIFEAPTIAQLSEILGQEATPVIAGSSLVKIQSGKSRPPLFCLPGNLGNVYTDLGPLSRFLGWDQPLYGLQDGLGHPSKVKDLANHYIEDIRGIQPVGPYFLCGICSGGVVAFEMAQQLIHQGEYVAFLALVEPAAMPLPGARSYYSLFSEIWERFSRHFSYHSQNVSPLNLSEKILYIRLKLKMIANLWALKHYALQPFPGYFHLMLTKESINSTRSEWREFANRVKVHEISGTHRGITGDYTHIEDDDMQTLAHILRGSIDEALLPLQTETTRTTDTQANKIS